MHNLNPDYHIPTPSTVARYIGIIYDSLKKHVISELSGKDIAMTTDMWTTIGHHNYITITCHYLTEDWSLKSRIIGTRPLGNRHTAVNLAEKVKGLAAECNVNSIVAITNDNAGNMVSMAKILAEDNIRRFGCFAHTLQLAVNEGLSLPVIAKMVAFSKKIVAHFSHSQPSMRALLEHQQRMGVAKPFNLVRDVETRWNSTYFLMKRLLHLKSKCPCCSV